MNVDTLILASVSRKSVYRRLAALSEEEKQQVVEKVKQKLKEKYPDSNGSQDTEEQAPAAEGDDTSQDSGSGDYFPPTESGDGDLPAEDESGDEAPSETPEAPETSESAPASDEPAENQEAEPTDDEEGSTPVEVSEDKAPASDENKDEEEKPEDDEQKEAGGEVVVAPEETVEEDLPDDDEEDMLDDDEDEEDDDEEVSAEEGSPAGEIVDEIEEDVGQIEQEGKVDPSRVLELFESMMKLHGLLLQSKLPRGIKARRNRTSSETMVDRLTRGVIANRVAARGQQLNRKDSDLMTDTGGTSKGMSKEPEFKPPRTDVSKPFRSKDKPADQRDPDTDSDPDKRRD